jgi:response regulator RpfG family c-di-GMP phosphodiesterase
MGLHERMVRHMAITERLVNLIERCAALCDAGKLTEARRLFRRVEQLNERLLEPEDIGQLLH